MSRELNKIKKRHEEIVAEVDHLVDEKIKKDEMMDEHLGQISAEFDRVAEIYRAPTVIIKDIEEQFKKATKLDGTDLTFLFLATALQCARQYLLPNDALRFSSHQQGDELMEKTVGRFVEEVKPEWHEVLFQSVPYDAIKTSAHVSDTHLSGITHRYRTLGHDPILGWIFGTANIMTNSLTAFGKVDSKTLFDQFETYQVKNMMMIRRYPSGTVGMWNRFTTYTAEDHKLFAASVARQAIHFGSDYFTKQGLPIPIIAVVNNDLAKKMIMNGHIDMYSVTRGALLSSMINALIGIIHRLFYDETQDGSRQMYEVRTRRVLLTSNVLATGSNVLITAFSQKLNWLDVGGLLVTLHRIVEDTKFIREIKRDFLKNELADRIRGSDYDFMEE